MEDQQPDKLPEGKPPFFSSWWKVYAFVLGFMAVLVSLFALFSNTYSR